MKSKLALILAAKIHTWSLLCGPFQKTPSFTVLPATVYAVSQSFPEGYCWKGDFLRPCDEQSEEYYLKKAKQAHENEIVQRKKAEEQKKCEDATKEAITAFQEYEAEK